MIVSFDSITKIDLIYLPMQKITLIDSQGFMVIGQQIGNKTVIIKGKQGQKPF